MRTIVLTAVLACAAPETAAGAQAGAADSAWVNLVTIRRLPDEFADRLDEAIDPRLHSHPTMRRRWKHDRSYNASAEVRADRVDHSDQAPACGEDRC